MISYCPNSKERNHIILSEKIIDAYSSHIQKLIERSECYVPFLITTRFKPFQIRSFQSRAEYALNEHDRFYVHLISRLINNHRRKKHLYPRSFNFVDVSSSKFTVKSCLDFERSLHIHSIFLVHVDTLPNFKTLAAEYFQPIVQYRSKISYQLIFPKIESVHSVPIADVCTIPVVVDYSAKLMKNYHARKLMSEVNFYSQNPASLSNRCSYENNPTKTGEKYVC